MCFRVVGSFMSCRSGEDKVLWGVVGCAGVSAVAMTALLPLARLFEKFTEGQLILSAVYISAIACCMWLVVISAAVIKIINHQAEDG